MGQTQKTKRPFEPLYLSITKLDENNRAATIFIQERVDKFLDSHNGDILRADVQANELSRQGSGQLITFATLLISVSALVMGQKELIASLSTLQRWCLCLTVAVLLMSIIFGVLGFNTAREFFTKWSGTLARMPEKLTPSVMSEMERTSQLYEFKTKYLREEGLVKGGDNGTHKSEAYWDGWQLGAVILGAAGYLALIISLLFDIPIIK